MRRTKEDAEKTRESLLQAAELVFGEKGYSATRLSDIADRANVTRGAIYHHFANKKELFLCLNKERVNPYLKILDQVFKLDLSPKEKIVRMMKEVIQRAVQDIQFLTKQRFEFLRDIELSDASHMQNYLEEKGNLYRSSMLTLVKEGQKNGEINTNIAPELMILNMEAYIKGLIAMIIMDKDREFIENQSNALVETFIGGL